MAPFASRQLPVWIFVSLLAVAFAAGLRTTHDLEFPGTDWQGVGIDLYRDISSAQTMLDAGYGPDPTYAGERTWYNPLTPAASAVVSRVTGAPVPRVTARIGAYANLLAPIAFFLLCAALFDRWTALVCGAGFLFLTSGALPSWVSATYSPWFMPVNFVQTLFYLTLLSFLRAYRDGRLLAFLLPGVLWGVTFLGHTAPALILGGMALLWVGAAWWTNRTAAAASARPGNARADTAAVPARPGRHTGETAGETASGGTDAGEAPRPAPADARNGTTRDVTLRVALMMLAAIIVSTPMIAIIAGHYGLRIQNPDPSAYSEPLLARELPTLVRLHLTLPIAFAAWGLVSLLRGRRRPAGPLLLAWIVSAGAFLVYGYARLALKLAGLTLPSIVPSFHFFFYLKAATAVLFGLGVMAAARAIAARFGAAGRAEQARAAQDDAVQERAAQGGAAAQRGGSRGSAPPPRAARAAIEPSESESASPALSRERAIAVLLTLMLLAIYAPTYLARADFAASRKDAQIAAAATSRVDAYTWLRDHLTGADVVLASDADAVIIVAPSGAKVVAIFSGFSNPYVPLDPRRDARDRMAAALDAGDSATFDALARRYGVTHVLTSGPEAATSADGAPVTLVRLDRGVPANLELVFTAGDRRIYRIRGAALDGVTNRP